jgi:hypothetical protein
MKQLTDFAPDFAFVVKNGFDYIQEYLPPDSAPFGNVVLSLRRNDVVLQFIQDRGQLLVDIGTAATGWFYLPQLLAAVEGMPKAAPLVGQLPPPAVLAAHLEQSWEQVMKVLTDERQRMRLLQTVTPQKSKWPYRS